jgi:NAD(P)-dependent dehydrogenase (short-subunit alcohol dehydrogenase family)
MSPSSGSTGLKGRTLFITGASRGIGLAIALRAARDGANIVIAAKTQEPHPKLPGTIYTAAKEIESAGGRALPLAVDIRDDGQVADAIARAVKTFGGIDILVNNASAIALTNTQATDMKRFDLMHQINTRGAYLCSKLVRAASCVLPGKVWNEPVRSGIGGGAASAGDRRQCALAPDSDRDRGPSGRHGRSR